MRVNPLTSRVKEILEQNQYDLSGRLPRKILIDIATQLGVKKYKVAYAINQLRRESPLEFKKAQMNTSNAFHESCKTYGFMRANKKETNACDAINDYLMHVLPAGGYGMLAGTPTPFCASLHKKNHHTIITDNLEVAIIMKKTCDQLGILIGNAVKPEKAQFKADTWVRISSMKRAEILIGPVNSESIARKVEALAKKYPLCKVVFLTSGTWTSSRRSRRKYSFNVNFRDPLLKISARYPGLHVLAMTMSSLVHFNVQYLYKGIEQTIPQKGGDINAIHHEVDVSSNLQHGVGSLGYPEEVGGEEMGSHQEYRSRHIQEMGIQRCHLEDEKGV